MKYIPKELTRDIREKSKLFETLKSPESVIKCQEIRKKIIEKNSQVHSYKMEHPHSRIPHAIPHNNQIKDIKIGIRNISNAFNLGVRNFNPSNFEEFFVREIAGRITPELYKGSIGRYRETGTRITGASITPPYPYKLINYEIPWFVESMNQNLQCKDIINKIETSIFAHLHMARMHPFVDGNGRTARTLQGVILSYYDIPLPVIEAGERSIYYSLLDKAVVDWNEKKGGGTKNGATYGEQLFYNFITGKINTSYDKLIEYCLKHK